MSTDVLPRGDDWLLRAALALAVISLLLAGGTFVAVVLSGFTLGIAIGMLGSLGDDTAALGAVAVGLAACSGAILWAENKRLELWPYPAMRVVAAYKFASAGGLLGLVVIVPALLL